jgi:uncharacterized ferritin-like protein (DUF455 family)
MELREWAESILSADTMEGKLYHPGSLKDEKPGSPLFWKEPVRPAGMGFKQHSKDEKLPSLQEHGNPDNRAACLHRFAGHELLAVEIMAFTLLAFPDAPPHFRKGLANTLREEQDHVRLYTARMNDLGIRFGDLPLFRHFWTHTRHITSPMHYVSMMCLTFEMANLDFAPIYGKSFLRHGDQESAQLMATILKDEIAHVGFGLNWLRRFKVPEQTEWDAWEKTLADTILLPKRAKGFFIHEEPRIEAGVSREWIQKLKEL